MPEKKEKKKKTGYSTDPEEIAGKNQNKNKAFMFRKK